MMTAVEADFPCGKQVLPMCSQIEISLPVHGQNLIPARIRHYTAFGQINPFFARSFEKKAILRELPTIQVWLKKLETNRLVAMNHRHKHQNSSPDVDEALSLTSQPSSVLYPRTPILTPFFAPRNIALIGASERTGSVGRTIFRNLLDHPFGGTVFPVNPKHKNILGQQAYPDVGSIPESIDLALICTPASTVPNLIDQCGFAEIPAAVVFSAGFKEKGESGQLLAEQVKALSIKHGIRVIGPNCLGLMVPGRGLNATFAYSLGIPGKVALLSQSGAICTAMLDWSLREKVGFRAMVSVGTMLDVDWSDLIRHFGEDPETESIAIYMESMGDPRAFFSAAREVALAKPIVVIKAGRTRESAQAAAAHTGNLVGNDDIINAAFERCGILRVDTIADLFYTVETLSKQRPPKGKRLAILTNAGGPAVLATDRLVLEGGKLATLAPETVEGLKTILPDAGSSLNPVDLLGDATPEQYGQALRLLANDPGVDGVLVILTLQAMTDTEATAHQICEVGRLSEKTILASWLGGENMAKAEKILNDGGIPTFSFPDTAARVFNHLCRHHQNLEALYETPIEHTRLPLKISGQTVAKKILDQAVARNQTILSEVASKKLLNAYGIPMVETRIAHTEEDASEMAQLVKFPVALKLHSEKLTHKAAVGGVALHLNSVQQVRQAFRSIQESAIKHGGEEAFQGVTVQKMITQRGCEAILGSTCDPLFGPAIIFGLGGSSVEILNERSIGLPPLTSTLARRLIEGSRIRIALEKIQAPRELVEEIICRFAQIVLDHPQIKEMEINPLLITAEEALVLDARIILHAPEIKALDLPKPVIRPYPMEYVKAWNLQKNAISIIRPIRPEDEPLMVDFHAGLSPETVYQRYLECLNLSSRVAHTRLIRVCNCDYDRDIVLVLDHRLATSGKHQILAVGRLSKTSTPGEAEIAVLVSDLWQGKGIGSRLMKELLEIARKEKITRLVGLTRSDNHSMLHIAHRLGFSSQREDGESTSLLLIDLQPDLEEID